LRPKTNADYFENAGPGMGQAELDEHIGDASKDFERFHQVRRTIDPSISNNSLNKSTGYY
jgi:hypothetical protein